MSRGADLLIRALQNAGVERLFALSGNQILPAFDACIGSSVELLHVRHEAAAVHMADAWGRLTGRPGVAIVSAGPGFANALSAMYVALAAESPLVLLAGHAPQEQLGRGGFQELQQAEAAHHVCKASWTVTAADRIGFDLARAFRIASSGRPGPVHLSLPLNVLDASVRIGSQSLPDRDDFVPAISLLDREVARQTLEHLCAAERPLVLAGPAAMRNGELLNGLSQATGIPAIGSESPRGVNDPSLGAFAEVLAQADLILLLGKRLDFTLRFCEPPLIAANCRFLQIDADTAVLQQTLQCLGGDERLLFAEPADPGASVERLTQEADGQTHPNTAWQESVENAIRYRPADWSAAHGSPGLHPLEVARGVAAALAGVDDWIAVSDGGEFCQWMQAALSPPRRFINGPAGAIGGAIPAALAAGLACPGVPVIAFAGDGGFGFHALEFDTAVRYGLPIVAIVGNDACWNAERVRQIADYGPDRTIAVDLAATRYDQLAASLGGVGEFVQAAAQLAPALRRLLDSPRPGCINVALQPAAAPIIRR